jgi:hypothetical protein
MTGTIFDDYVGNKVILCMSSIAFAHATQPELVFGLICETPELEQAVRDHFAGGDWQTMIDAFAEHI